MFLQLLLPIPTSFIFTFFLLPNGVVMLSQPSKHPLNPNAQPFYMRPNHLFVFPPPPHYYYYYAPSCAFTFFSPTQTVVTDTTYGPTCENVKRGSVGKRVWEKGRWHKFSKTRGRVKVGSNGKKLLENETILPFPKTVEEAETSSITTVMIRNLPNQFKFDDLLLILDEYCLLQNKDANEPSDWSKFDFVYLPMDYRKHALEKRMSNLGYAFVNFTTPSAAFVFHKKVHGLQWNVAENRKTCEINVAQYQGKDTLMKIFAQKVFRCKSRELLPVVFPHGRDGLNRRIEGTYVGNHVRGLPRTSIGACASS